MKQVSIVILMFVLMLSGLSITAQNGKKPENPKSPDARVEVYYFHFTQRCATCRAVENNARSALDILFPEKVKKGEYSFKGINLDDADSKPVARKWGIGGQTLLVVCGNKKVDLTTMGFLYAHEPDKMQSEIKNAVEKVTRD